MLPSFLELGLVNTNLFIDWRVSKHGHNLASVVDFNGLPAIPPQHDDLAPQALTDRQCDLPPQYDQVDDLDKVIDREPTHEQQYNRAVMDADGTITTNFMADGSTETYHTLPHEPAAPATGVTSIDPKPAIDHIFHRPWRRF